MMHAGELELGRLPPERTASFSVVATVDRLSGLAGTIAAGLLALLTAMVCYDVVARYVFNEGTTWVTEIGTYMFVAVVFLGLAAAQRANAHVQVEILVDRLAPEARRFAELVGLWLGLLLVLVCAWQTGRFTAGEFVNGTRDWGLLGTPQWIPQIPLTLGYVLLAAALLNDIHRLRAPASRALEWVVPVSIGLLLLVLVTLGRSDVRIGGTRFDWGTVTIAAAIAACVWAWSGWRVAAVTLGSIAVLALLFNAARGAGPGWTGSLLAGSLAVLLFSGVRVAFAMGIVGMLGMYFLLPAGQLPILAERSWMSINTFTLTAVPSFVLMGALLVRSGITTDLFDSLVRWFGRTPGGLAHASVAASATFAAVCGSSLATAATLGSVAAPEMVKRHYSPRLTYGVVAAGATLGILIPPSIPLIIYGNVVGAPVTKLFLAGIVPGLLLSALLMLTVLVWTFLVRGSVPTERSYTLADKVTSTVKVLPFLILIAVVLGSMYMGVATPTEAGALGSVAAFAMALHRRKLTWASFYEALEETARVTAFIMLIVVGAAFLSYVFDFLRLPRVMVTLVTEAQLAPWLVMSIIVLVYLVLGCFIESIAMILMTLSVVFPIVTALGFDPIWFGIVLVLLVELGLITPPVGLVLFVLKGMSVNVSLRDIALGAIPFIFVMLGFIALLYLFPGLALWLPSTIAG